MHAQRLPIPIQRAGRELEHITQPYAATLQGSLANVRDSASIFEVF